MIKFNQITIVYKVTLIFLTGIFSVGPFQTLLAGEEKPAPTSIYRSPYFLVISPDGKTVYVSDRTAGSLVVIDAILQKKLVEIPLRGKPHGLTLSADGETLFVAENGVGSVAVIDTKKLAVESRISVGKWPTAVVAANKTRRLYVCNADSHTVSVIDLSQMVPKTIGTIPVVREPSSASLTPDEKILIVANLLTYGRGTDPELSAKVSIIDTMKMTSKPPVSLPPGSTSVKGLCLSPDGKWAYVVHSLGRFNLPVTQLERGWVNTFALSIINIPKGKRLATVLLDNLKQGAADPHSVVCSPDGKRLLISHSGVQEISLVNIGKIHELLEGIVPPELAALKDGVHENIWVQIQNDRSKIAELENDLTALYIAEVIRRVPSGGMGPRGIALFPDGSQLCVANYFSGLITFLDAQSGKQLGNVSMGTQPPLDPIRHGEMVFNDATKAFQRWHSCATCHPNDGRVDGLRWDFMNDGIGNPKDTLSLIFAHKNGPMNRRGTHKTAKQRVIESFPNSHLIIPTEKEAEDVYQYITSLKPDPNPYLLPDGQFNKKAKRGKILFNKKGKCSKCHTGPTLVDKKKHNVGTASQNDGDGQYSTPSLLEAHRTAPYLNDGRALTLKEVFTRHNKKNRHGNTKEFSEQELDDLIEYLRSL